MISLLLLVVFSLGAVMLLDGGDVLACSRVLSADNGQAVLTGRNMDWPVNIGNELWVFPRGMKRNGLIANPITWTSKYGSMILASFFLPGKGATVNGMNEKGLAADALWLDKSDYGVRDERVPGLAISLWAQYIIDNYATVEEAVQALRKTPYQIMTFFMPEGDATVTAYIHLSLEDKTGDSAIIEYVGGKQIIHHDRKYAVMTNEPPLEEQQENLKQYEGFGGTKPLPGTTTPEDRFVRASYYLKYLPKPNNLREALAGIFSVMRNAAQPFRASVDPRHPNTSATLWRLIGDLTNGTYYFESTTSPYIVWAGLNEFDLNEGASPMKLDLNNNPDLSGDVSKLFVKAEPFEYFVSK